MEALPVPANSKKCVFRYFGEFGKNVNFFGINFDICYIGTYFCRDGC